MRLIGKPLAMVKSEERDYESRMKASIGKQVHHLWSHRRRVYGVSMSAQFLITCSADATVRVFDRSTYKELMTYSGHNDAVFSCNFLSSEKNEKMVVSCSRDGSAKVWNCESGHTRFTFRHANSVKSAVSDKGLIVTFSLLSVLTFWSLTDGCRLMVLDNIMPVASPLAVSLPYVAFGTFGRMLYVYQMNDPSQAQQHGVISIKKVEAHKRAILSVAINSDATMILSGSEDKTAAIYQIVDGEFKPRRIFVGHSESVSSVSFLVSNKSIVFTTSLDKTARIWDVSTGGCIMVMTCNSAVFSGSLDRCFAHVGCADNSAVIFDVTDGNCDRLLLVCLGATQKSSLLNLLPIEILKNVGRLLL